MQTVAERPVKPEPESRRVDARRLLPSIAGLALMLLALAMPTGDWRWFLLWAGGVAAASGLVATCASSIGPDGSTMGTRPTAGFKIASAIAVLIAASLLGAATSSENPVPSFGSMLVLIVPVVVGAVVVLISVVVCRLLRAIDRTSAFVGVLAAVACLAAAVMWGGHQPLNRRVATQEDAMNRRAEALLADPSAFTDQRTLRDPSQAALGDFQVSDVDVDDFDLKGCVPPPGIGGLYFRVGSEESSTVLIYCPLRDVEAGSIHTSVDHVAGPWFVEYVDD